ncbi:hypothetical protein [Marinobacterium sp. BA1]|uniref:hypothetical protein n=1 Tax=Marinobacterium sp. BA1 TaxID=3138931 RepID=UPI0032E5C1D2
MKDPLNIMPEGVPLKSDKFYNIDGWERIYTGEEFRRPKDLQRVAITRVEITFSSEKNFEKFFSFLKESDDRLSKVPDSEVMYDWQSPIKNGLTIRFGVAWYDQDFYIEKKEAYLDKMHENLFKQFGAKVDDIRVEHIPL